MSEGVVAEVADRLWQAEIGRSPISPITDAYPELVIEDAYAIQSRNIDRRVGVGRVIRGRKVGLTAKPMQDLFGVREPDFGVLLDDMFVEDGDEISLATLLQPRVEAEMAFLIGRDLTGPGVTTANALAAIAGVLPSIEIVDSRIADWKIRLADTVADNASSAKLVIGGKLTAVTDFDLRLGGMVMTRNGVVIESGVNRILPPGEVLPHAKRQCARLAQLPPTALRETKRLLKAGWREATARTIAEESAAFARLLRSAEAREAFSAFLERRAPDFSKTQ